MAMVVTDGGCVSQAVPQSRGPSSPQLGELGLDFIHVAAQKIRDLDDRHVLAEKILQVGHVHGGPWLAAVDVLQAGGRLRTHTQHASQYRTARAGIRVDCAGRPPDGGSSKPRV